MHRYITKESIGRLINTCGCSFKNLQYNWKLRSTMTKIEKIVKKTLKTTSCYCKNQIMSWFDNKKHATNLKIFIEKKKKKLTFHIKLMSENSKEFFLNNIKNQNQNQNQ